MSADTLLPQETQLLAQKAIEKALRQDWQEAVRINTTIIESDEANIDALNRLAFAYGKLGEGAHAKRYYQKVLKLDPYNQIASKNLKKLASIKRKSPLINNQVSPLMFLEEPGKTKIVSLLNVAPERILAGLFAGQEVFLKIKKHCIEIRDEHGIYLGALPDDISFKLIKFVSGGNEYNAVVKSIGKNQLLILLRELKRGKRFARQPSFITTLSYIPFKEHDGEAPDTTATGEESEQDRTNEDSSPSS